MAHLNAIRFTLIFRTQQTHNTIPYDSPIHHAIQNGQTEQAKAFKCSGSASSNEVKPFGLELLDAGSVYLAM